MHHDATDPPRRTAADVTSTVVGVTELSWTREGTGPELVMINGYGATAADWDPVFLEALAAQSTVVRIDNAGMGASPPSSAAASIASMAEDVRRVVERLSGGPCPVLGWSMGGFIAQQLAADAPQCVSALVLLSTDPGGDLAVQRSPDVSRQLYDHSGSPAARAERLIDVLFPPPLATTIVERFGDVVAAAQAAIDLDVVRAQEDAMAAWYAERGVRPLGATDVPVLLAAGAEDVVIPSANVSALATQSAHAWTALFDGCGHAFMAQEPRRLAALINAFLDRSPVPHS